MKKLLKEAVKKKLIQSIDFQFSNFICKNDEPAVMLAAACTSNFYGKGNICLPIKLLLKKYFKNPKKKIIKKMWKIINKIKSTQDWVEILKKSHSIGMENSRNPIILFKKNLYLYKAWKMEKKIFNFIKTRNNTIRINKKKFEKINKKIKFDEKNIYQKIAIFMGIFNKVSFIMGGPGTGKTTLVSKLIISIIRFSEFSPIIKLVATTGKAADNLSFSIKTIIPTLNLTKLEKKIFPNNANTLHHLLKIKPGINNSLIQKKIKINADILIIDESSMIDFFMMYKLIGSISSHTKLVFIGDHNQLPPIGTGFLLNDISFFYQYGYTKKFIELLKKMNFLDKKSQYKTSNLIINNNICMLKKSYRFSSKSGIYKFSSMLKLGKKKIIKKIINNTFSDIKYVPVTNHKEYKKMILLVALEYKKYFKSIKKKQSPKKIITLFNNYRLICVLKKGLFGTKYVNRNIEKKMKDLSYIQPTVIKKEIWYVGKPILIKENNKNLNIFNGNIGITFLDAKMNFSVFFLSLDDSIKTIPINLLPKYETAWTITVHKSQGSEFSHTGILLPLTYVKTLSKELLYTAVTRSKKKLTIYGNKKVLSLTIDRKITRYSGIKEKLKNYKENN
ncbi:exodeoxyribonuclease V subunit alpha [Buchnera aphidicola]|uniref:exodeoxyribonuclease V subunit alpha n=1 Tax=Buchnera aphidicola TaxID=9 RepID=UPI00346421B1